MAFDIMSAGIGFAGGITLGGGLGYMFGRTAGYNAAANEFAASGEKIAKVRRDGELAYQSILNGEKAEKDAKANERKTFIKEVAVEVSNLNDTHSNPVQAAK